MTKTTPRLFVALLACLLLALPVAAKDIARVSVTAGELVFMPEAAAAGFQLTVTGPGGYLHTETFDGSGAMAWSAQSAGGGVLANGAYNYELRPIAHQVKRGSELAGGKPELTALSGTVTVRDGSLVNPDRPEESLTKDIIHADDVIIQGSVCVGFDCANGESFGSDTIRLKENNLRIKFEDTSTGTFPSNDWQLTANDSNNGGANRFSIDDITGGKTPFTIEAAAPSNSLYVDDAGNLGLGTSTPVLEIHVKDGDSPALRLEQDGSSGFGAQTWDIAGNETNFFVRDVTNGSKLPFKIFPNAPNDSLTIEGSTGDVGVGTKSPGAKLHSLVGGAAFSAFSGTALVLQSNAATGDSAIATIISGATGTGQLNFGDSSNEFQGRIIYEPNIDRLRFFTGGSVKMTVEDSGNVTIAGGLITTGGGGACTSGDPCDGVFKPDFALPTIEEHAAFMWENSYLPAVGPTSEQGPFNVTRKVGGILNELEKAHIYIEQLHNTIKQMNERLEKLEKLENAQ